MRRKKFITFCFIILIVSCSLLIVGTKFLSFDEEPRKADVIIVLSGNSEGSRLIQGASLYKAGFADNVMISNSTDPNFGVTHAVNLGIPKDKIIPEEKATSTYTNALYTKSEMEKHQFTSAIVVTADYHLKRAKLTFDRVYEDSDMELTYVAAYQNGEPWYKQMSGIPLTLSEMIKASAYKMQLYEFIDL